MLTTKNHVYVRCGVSAVSGFRIKQFYFKFYSLKYLKKNVITSVSLSLMLRNSFQSFVSSGMVFSIPRFSDLKYTLIFVSSLL